MPEDTLLTATPDTPEAASGQQAGADSGKPADATPADASTPESGTAAATDAKPGDTPDPKPEEGDKPQVPETYELKLPEGAALQPEAVERLAAFAKEQGLSNDAAQKVLEAVNQEVGGYVEAQKVLWAQQTNDWLTEIKNDKELGGDNLKETDRLATHVARRFGGDEFVEALRESGFGNNPGVVRLLVRIGKAMSEDTLEMPNAEGGGTRSLEEIFYGKTE